MSERLLDRGGNHRRQVLALFAEARRAEHYTRLLLDQHRHERLAALLNHARLHVPRYREWMAAWPAIDSARAPDLLRRLPVIGRVELQADPGAFVTDDGREMVDDFTGGSTGTPLAFKVDRATQRAREASLMWANGLAGWSRGERVAMLWGSDRDARAARRDWRLQMRWLIDNMRWYNAFTMGEGEMTAFHRDLQKFQPHLLVAYAGSLYTFARFLQEKGWVPDYPRTALVSSAEVMTPPMRKLVEEVFRRPVFDRYGNREAGAIAAECGAHNGLHINEEDFLVEIDSADPERTAGRVIMTYFRNFAMPLIRYDTGDLARTLSGKCPCGRPTARLRQIVGRQSDTIRTAAGKLVHGEFFTHVLYGARQVKEFQFVQETLTQYRLRVVAEGTDAAEEQRWRDKILETLGPGNELTIEHVREVPALPSGKRRFTLSLLQEDAGAHAGETP